MKECDVCGKEMYDTSKGCVCIGTTISLTGEHAEIQRTKDMFGKTDFAICFCCWLKSLSIKVINKHKDCYNEKNGLANMPIEHIGKFYNACTDPCDMLIGPCACGAAHRQEEWPDWLQLEVFGFVSNEVSTIKRKELIQ